MNKPPIREDAAALAGYDRDVSGHVGRADASLRARDAADVGEALAWARARQMAVLPVGAQTSTTGASVPDGGLVIDLSGLDGAPQLDSSALEVHACPGTRIQALDDWLRPHGLELPVDPTSAAQCTVGGAIATNASGASSFRYGAMANWVQAIELIDGAGNLHRLRRRAVSKCAMGPRALQDPIDFIVGSEGTLGIIIGATLRVQRAPAARLGALIACNERKDLIAAVILLRQARHRLPIRCIEWLDGACCELLEGHAAGLVLPDGPAGGIYLETEGQGGANEAMLALESALSATGVRTSAVQLLPTASDRRHFSQLRHRVPDILNRRGAALAGDGGGKLSTDWSVPLAQLHDLLSWTEDALARHDLGTPWAYGHIGDGHPHLNLLCPDGQSRARAQGVLAEQLRRVVELGGSPVSEHGIGKIKRDLIAPCLPAGFRAAFSGLRRHFDPQGMLAPGNVLSTTDRKT